MAKGRGVVSPVLASACVLGVLVFGCSRAVEHRDESLPTPPREQQPKAEPAMPAVPPPPHAPRATRAEEAAAATAEVMHGVEGGVAGGVVGGVLGGVVGGVAADSSFAPLRVDPFERSVGPLDTEAYAHVRDNAFLAVTTHPLSTFSIDVDTASYANVRRFLEGGQRPPKDAVRIEELLNYFRYDYPQPAGTDPFSVTTEVFGCPWASRHRLVSIGLQGRRLADEAVPPRNLVFLLDVSGSMQSPRKLPLLRSAMKLLVEQMREQDRVAIVVYAGSSGLVLPPTSGAEKPRLHDALDRLEAGGSTAGAAGIELAYEVAARSFITGGINRVVLATDGDFNVGVTSEGELVRLIEEKRRSGVFLSVLGFGDGNLKDSTMEKLADSGNGNYAYIDSLFEARKVLVREAGATLVTIAKDVKLQVEFNPARVAAYRLIGYENRVLAAEDFNDDRKDAGEIGAGHSVTALYELVPVGVDMPLPRVDPLKYQAPRAAASSRSTASRELLTVKLRYKDPEGETSRPRSVAVVDGEASRPSPNARWASAVAGFGMLLRDSEHKGSLGWADVRALARDARGADHEGDRAEFCRLVDTAEALLRETRLGRNE